MAVSTHERAGSAPTPDQKPDQNLPTLGGGQRRASPVLRGYAYALAGLSELAGRVRDYRDAANDPEVDDRRRNRRAAGLLVTAGGFVVLGAAAEVAKAYGAHVPAVSDLFSGGEFGAGVADCVNEKTANLPPPPTDPLGNPIAQPGAGVPREIFDACVDQVQQAQNGK